MGQNSGSNRPEKIDVNSPSPDEKWKDLLTLRKEADAESIRRETAKSLASERDKHEERVSIGKVKEDWENERPEVIRQMAVLHAIMNVDPDDPDEVEQVFRGEDLSRGDVKAAIEQARSNYTKVKRVMRKVFPDVDIDSYIADYNNWQDLEMRENLVERLSRWKQAEEDSIGRTYYTTYRDTYAEMGIDIDDAIEQLNNPEA